MAMRKFRQDHGDVPGAQLQVVGLSDGYHGDTLGATDAVSPSAYTGLNHYPWRAPVARQGHAPLILGMPAVSFVQFTMWR